MEKKKGKFVLPEEALVIVLARSSSLRSIARFRSVCKRWKSIIDSDFFRDIYESLNTCSSLSWSITNNRNRTLSHEIVGYHGCKRWGLTKSLGSWMMRYEPETTVRKVSVLSCAGGGLVLLYTETSDGAPMYHVGNPLLQQWARIPLPPHLSGYDVARLQENRLFSDTGLVTKMEKGIAVGYKVVWTLVSCVVSKVLTLMIYSSETGLWETKEVCCIRVMIWSRLNESVPLNGILHWLASVGSDQDANYVVTYDFYNEGDDEGLIIIPFPGMDRKHSFRRLITTSAGFVMYCNVSNANGCPTIRVWRLVKYCNQDPNASWMLTWQKPTSLFGLGADFSDFFPVVMHPLYSNIMYMWSRKKNGLVELNLTTLKYRLHTEGSEENNKCIDDCILRLSGCKEYMDSIDLTFSSPECGPTRSLYFSQYVLPRWLNPLPRLSS